MKIKFNARKFNLTDDVKARFQKKLSKLDKFFPDDTETDVALFEEKIGERVEITIHRGGTIFRAEETGKDYICALDNAMDVLERQIRRNRTRLEKKKQIPKSIVYDVEPIDNDDTEDELIISKTKHFDILPMTTEEAILQMNLLSHTFFLFQNVKTGALNVVYKRKKNNYGIIEPND